MKRKRFEWLKIAAVAVPLLAFLVFVNCYFDPANIFHNVSRSIADSLLKGNATYITSGNMNERRVKQYIIEDMADDIDCVSLGTSVMFGIRKEHVGTEKYYNLGLSGADFYDIMAQFGLMEINGKTPKRVIFCVDTYFFNEEIMKTFTRSIPLKPYANYMISVLNGESPDRPAEDTTAENIQKFKQMFSVSNFQAAFEYITEYGSLDIERWGVADESYEGEYSYYLADGSMMYPLSYRSNTTEDVVQEALGYDINYYFSAGEHISTSNMEIFEKLVCYLEEQGTEVVLFLCPLCPTLWDRCSEETTPILWEVEDFVNEMAEKYDIKVVGSYNPHTYGIADADFYDSRHLRHEVLEKFFDFK